MNVAKHENFIFAEDSPQDFIQTLEKTIKSFIGDAPQFDDLTSLAFKAI